MLQRQVVGAQSRAEVVSERGRGSSEWEGEKSVKRESDGGGGAGAQTFCYLDEYVRQMQVVGDTVVCGAPSASSPPPLAPLAAPGAASRDPLAPEAHTLEPP